MSRPLRALLFGLLCALQIGVATSTIHRQQVTLAEGTLYKFRTGPVDPADPFRGKYVALSFPASCVDGLGAQPRRVRRNARGYASLATDADGFARISVVTKARPESGDYFVVRGIWGCEVRLPFDRYYLPEHQAPEAERLYRASLPTNFNGENARRPAYVAVRVRDGYAALEELYIEDRPVRELLKDFSSAPATP